MGSEEMLLKQRKREIKCALNLREKIVPYCEAKSEDDKDSFRASIQQEAAKIADTSFGATFLVTIGFALEVEGEEFLGFQNTALGVGGHAAQYVCVCMRGCTWLCVCVCVGVYVC